MGANSKQGWYLFLFLVGFTFLPAGLAYLGAIFTLIGAIAMVASIIGFIQIRPLEFEADKANPRVVGGGKP
jgi:hypothetical protein